MSGKEIVVATTPAKRQNEKIIVVSSQPASGNNNSKRRQKNQKKRRNRRRNRAAKRAAFAATPSSFFQAALLAPDIYGPVRIPRRGATRTGLGYDATDVAFTGTATSTNVFVIQADSKYTNAVNKWGALLDPATGFGAATTVVASSQFPTAVQMADCNVVAISIVAYYIGNPLNVQGECIIGAALPLATTATYAGMYYYPGVTKIPISQLIQHPLRISARKLSPVSDEFVPTNTGAADIDLPFMAFTGLPSGGTIQCLVTRTWEYRSTTVVGSVIPYERVGDSHTVDLNAYQDACADIAQLSTPLTEALPEGTSESLSGMLGMGRAAMLGGVGALAGMARQFYLGRARGGNPNRFTGPDQLMPFQQYVRDLV